MKNKAIQGCGFHHVALQTSDFEKSLKGKTFYRHIYKANDVTCTSEGELIVPDLKLTNATTVLRDVIAPYSVVVYTTKRVVK